MSITKINNYVGSLIYEVMFALLTYCQDHHQGPGYELTLHGTFTIDPDTKYGIIFKFRWPNYSTVYIWDTHDKTRVMSRYGKQCRKHLRFEWCTSYPEVVSGTECIDMIRIRKAVASTRERFNSFMNWDSFNTVEVRDKIVDTLIKYLTALNDQRNKETHNETQS